MKGNTRTNYNNENIIKRCIPTLYFLREKKAANNARDKTQHYDWILEICIIMYIQITFAIYVSKLFKAICVFSHTGLQISFIFSSYFSFLRNKIEV